MGKTICFLLFLFFVLVAVKTKKSLQRRRNITQLENIVESPASFAIAELVAVAGGIYLALILLTSFLKISMPERLVFFDWSVDYLAAIAILIALLQPICLALYYKISHKI
ncbi:MAG TPA: hypothetical protein GX532_05045 [Clostridia bacterium]|jgi:hypothetical protein|nr:hypothetical protein [Clostridia bacterium]HHY06325.1 hypothetical protein [Clostridia bacterium]